MSLLLIFFFLTLLPIIRSEKYCVSEEASNILKAKQIVKELAEEVRQSELLSHDFLRCFAVGGYRDMEVATKEFALNHYAYSRNFINYLTSVRAKLAAVSPDDVHLISENMEEEMGHYTEEDYEVLGLHGIRRDLIEDQPHKVLVRVFLEKAGVNESMFDNDETIGAIFTRDMLRMYDESNACDALAIIGFAIEQTVPSLYQHIWTGLKEHTHMNPEDFVFFPLHILVDDGHAEHLQDAFAALYRKKKVMCENAPNAVRKVLSRRARMFTDLKTHVEKLTGGKICPADAEYTAYDEVDVTQHLTGMWISVGISVFSLLFIVTFILLNLIFQ